MQQIFDQVKDASSIAIYGYSAGGQPARELSNSLTGSGREVSSLILVDPVVKENKLPESGMIQNRNLVKDSAVWISSWAWSNNGLGANEYKNYGLSPASGHRIIEDRTARAAVDRLNKAIKK